MAAELLPVDPNINVPRAVKAATLRAEDIYKDAYVPPAPPAADGNPAGNPPAEPPVPPAEATPPAEPPAPPAPVNWEHRYKSMEGRYKRAEQQIGAMGSHLSDLTAQLEHLQAQLSQRQQEPPKPSVPLITPEEEKEYGSDLLSVVGKRAKQELSPEVAALKAEIAELKGHLSQVGKHVTQDARGRMLADLEREVPNWRQLNEDERFVNWLQLTDTYSGVTRQILLRQAFEQNVSPRVLAFFKGFLAEEAAIDPADSPAPSPAAPEPGAAPKVPLETLAAPGRAKSAASSQAPAEKPYITTRQISQFYADLAAGRYAGREKQAAEIEQQIFLAQREGRVTR